MVGKEIRQIRCEDILRYFMRDSSPVFLTLTTPKVVGHDTIRAYWRSFRHELCRKLPNVKYVMNYEVHPKGHGWHIHCVFSRFLPMSLVLPIARQSGFGIINIKKINTQGVADYLTKHCLKALRGYSQTVTRIRLVNASRGLPVLSDYVYRSAYRQSLASLIRRFRIDYPRAFSSIPFAEVSALCSSVLIAGSRSAHDVYYLLHDGPDHLTCIIRFCVLADLMRWKPVIYHQLIFNLC